MPQIIKPKGFTSVAMDISGIVGTIIMIIYFEYFTGYNHQTDIYIANLVLSIIEITFTILSTCSALMLQQSEQFISDDPEANNFANTCVRFCCLIPNILISEACALFKTYYTFNKLSNYATFFLTAYSLVNGIKILVEFIVGNVVHVINQMVEAKVKEKFGKCGRYCIKFLTMIGIKLFVAICLISPYLGICLLLFATIILDFAYWPIINVTCTVGLVAGFYGYSFCCLPLILNRMIRGQSHQCCALIFVLTIPIAFVVIAGFTMINMIVTVKTFFDGKLIQNGVDNFPNVKYLVIPAMIVWIAIWFSILKGIIGVFRCIRCGSNSKKTSCKSLIAEILDNMAWIAAQLCPIFWVYAELDEDGLMWYGIGVGAALYVSGVIENWGLNGNDGQKLNRTGSINRDFGGW